MSQEADTEDQTGAWRRRYQQDSSNQSDIEIRRQELDPRARRTVAMSLNGDTQAYERWLATQCDVLKHDLKRKHKKMGQDAFVFLRATYYRWARKILDWCPEVAKAPKVRAIGDAHTENFGIWRDGEGRLVWGVNDFDEAVTNAIRSSA